MKTHWKEITPSEFSREREALAFVRERLPDHEPYRAWSNFEFITSTGSIYEVDLLVLTPKGFYLVEIKSRAGQVTGDAGTWTWVHQGRRTTDDNPLLLANRKAKALIGLLKRQAAMKKVRAPFLDAFVFLSAEDNNARLPEEILHRVHTRDVDDESVPRERRGIVAALTRWPDNDPPRHRVDKPLAKALTRAMEQTGIRPARRARRAGDYELEELVYEGPGYQDWSARHTSLPDDLRRVRIYAVEPGASEEMRASVTRAAQREYNVLRGISHEGILKTLSYTEHERGPALFFEHAPGAVRLDHYLTDRRFELTVDQRLHLVRQVADALRYAHEKHLVHRALSPQSILVIDPDATLPRLQIFNWQTGIRERETTGATRLGPSLTTHFEHFVEEPATVYLAPEALSERGRADQQADVFSLGALAYLLFSGHAPAGSFIELTERLREGHGLRIASVLDGAPEALQDLVQFSTYPEVTGRLDSVAEFLDELDRYEDALTTPDPDPDVVTDPTQARPGDRLEHGLVVRRRLGKGSTAVALLVEHEGRNRVLKVALGPDKNDDLRAEGEVLEKLRHQFIVDVHGTLDFAGRVGLIMDQGGEHTLAQRLREEGRLALEFLERFGEDLLETVDSLEDQGIAHRDIKPDNLGVAPIGRGDTLHLVLFDFSLARTPADNIYAGTVPYLDPFLSSRRPPRWDTHAERFAAAMTLYQMATGALPTWGDGQSEPAAIDAEVSLDGDAFEPALRESMLAFFARALARDYRSRFDNAAEMLAAWKAIFTAADAPEVTTDTGVAPAAVVALADAELDTLLSALGLSTRALNALERAGLRTVSELLAYPFSQLRRLRGVGSKTRRELAELLAALTERFPDAARAPRQTPKAAEPVLNEPDELPAVDTLAAALVPAHSGTATVSGGSDLVSALLGLVAAEGAGTSTAPGTHVPAWPSQSDVARQARVNPGNVSHALARARKRWLKNPDLTALREALVELLEAQGGVMTADEIAEAVVSTRGSDQPEPRRSIEARALVRALVEAERDLAAPRWTVRRPRSGHCILVVRDAVDASGETRTDGQKLADYAERLGREVDALAKLDPLATPARALAALEAVVPPAGVERLPARRLLALGVATGQEAALSSRLEIYPRGMPAARTLKLSLGALAGARELEAQHIRERVSGRFPEAEALPDGAALAGLLDEAGSELVWRPESRDGKGVFAAPLQSFLTVDSGTSYARTATDPRFTEVPAAAAETRNFQQRLDSSLASRHFLALVARPRDLPRVEAALTSTFDLEVRSVDAMLIHHMKVVTEALGASWSVVIGADAVAPAEREQSQDWSRLLMVVDQALPRLDAELRAASGHTLLTNLGLLARYDRLAALNDLRDATGRPGGPPGLWLLVAGDGQDSQPVVDGRPLPVFTTAQWARIPDPWLAQALAAPAA